MKLKKTLSMIISIINIIGFLCLIYFAIPYLTQDTVIPNPNAMLPLQNWDSAGMLLTMGFIPLLIANILGFIYVEKNMIKMPLRLLFFIPSLICICLVISYWITSLN